STRWPRTWPPPRARPTPGPLGTCSRTPVGRSQSGTERADKAHSRSRASFRELLLPLELEQHRVRPLLALEVLRPPPAGVDEVDRQLVPLQLVDAGEHLPLLVRRPFEWRDVDVPGGLRLVELVLGVHVELDPVGGDRHRLTDDLVRVVRHFPAL